ncbi:MAG TPA: FHA domain-containing protein [Chloroflexota bacterium]|nr:FHA domain-containing protein [Chloroflexota bacterium]
MRVQRCPHCHTAGSAARAAYLEFPDGRRTALEDKEVVTLGRGRDNDLVLPDRAISRRHARLQRLPDGWLLIDLHSRNGTWVNGERVTGPYLLQDGDLIALGEQRLTYRVEREPLANPARRVEAETILGRAAFRLPPRPAGKDQHPASSGNPSR